MTIPPNLLAEPEGLGRFQHYPPSALLRWCKFNFVGGIGIVVQFAALFLLKSVCHLNYLAATALAVEAAVLHNFVWHEQFTWVDRVRSDRIKPDRVRPSWRRSLPRFLRFHLTNGAVSILGNLVLMKVMVGQGHMNYLLANAIAIAVCSLANFLLSDTWVLGSRAIDPPSCLCGAACVARALLPARLLTAKLVMDALSGQSLP